MIEINLDGKKPTRAQLRRQGLDDFSINAVLAQFGEAEPLIEIEEEEYDAQPAKTPRQKVLASTDPADIFDPTLLMASDIVTDMERTRISNENRLRQLTRSEDDSDGNQRGLGLDERHPEVARLVGVVEGQKKLEEDTIKGLENAVRKNPLGPWIDAQTGLGYKQVGRLLGSIGDPYWHTGEDRPRTVGELWSYAGHGGESKRRKGQKVNWSPDAKMRLWNIANSCIKSKGHYRKVYEDRRAETAEKLHSKECVRCGPSGKPAQPGSPWAKGHQHADALRVVGKEILRDLWVESKRIHEA